MRDTHAVMIDLVRELHIEAKLAAGQGRALNDRARMLPAPLERLEPLAEARELYGRAEGLMHAADRIGEALEAG